MSSRQKKKIAEKKKIRPMSYLITQWTLFDNPESIKCKVLNLVILSVKVHYLPKPLFKFSCQTRKKLPPKMIHFHSNLQFSLIFCFCISFLAFPFIQHCTRIFVPLGSHSAENRLRYGLCRGVSLAGRFSDGGSGGSMFKKTYV
jgi:hypothetical protein